MTTNDKIAVSNTFIANPYELLEDISREIRVMQEKGNDLISLQVRAIFMDNDGECSLINMVHKND